MKARIKFSKYGALKFIGHLDVMRYFQKAIRRSGIDIQYSQGYSPHQLISFAAPLGVGLTSDGEYMDMELGQCLSNEEMVDRLNAVMTEGIRVTGFCPLPEDAKNAMSSVSAADYLVSYKDGYDIPQNFETSFQQFMDQDQIVINKKTKRSEVEMDIKPFIYGYAMTETEFNEKMNADVHATTVEQYKNQTVLYLRLATGSVTNIKPELVMEAFYQYLNVPMNEFAFQMHRIEVYQTFETEVNSTFVPMNQFEVVS